MELIPEKTKQTKKMTKQKKLQCTEMLITASFTIVKNKMYFSGLTDIKTVGYHQG